MFMIRLNLSSVKLFIVEGGSEFEHGYGTLRKDSLG